MHPLSALFQIHQASSCDRNDAPACTDRRLRRRIHRLPLPALASLPLSPSNRRPPTSSRTWDIRSCLSCRQVRNHRDDDQDHLLPGSRSRIRLRRSCESLCGRCDHFREPPRRRRMRQNCSMRTILHSPMRMRMHRCRRRCRRRSWSCTLLIRRPVHRSVEESSGPGTSCDVSSRTIG